MIKLLIQAALAGFAFYMLIFLIQMVYFAVGDLIFQFLDNIQDRKRKRLEEKNEEFELRDLSNEIDIPKYNEKDLV